MPMANLDKIKIEDYQKCKTNKKWLKKTKVPNYFWKKFADITPETTVDELLTKIDKELMSFYGKKRDKGRSFKDSRFTAIPQILKRGMVSCGALSRIFSAVLKNFEIPTKLVHGRIKGRTGANRHAWLKIYNPKIKKWIVIDPTKHHKKFKLSKKARQLKIYSDWSELKKDYQIGKF